jgi:Flp pilus assembly protein TadG
MRALSDHLRRFGPSTSGAALVEFAVSLPLMLILVFGAFESQRLLWSYQAAVAGVRDAARYVARVADDDICDTAGASGTNAALTALATTALNRIVIPGGVTVTGVNVAVDCVPSLGLRQAIVPRARVTADLRIALPFTAVFALAGGEGWGVIETSVIEEARIYGI